MIPDHGNPALSPQQYPVLPHDEELGAELSARIHNLTPHVVRLLARAPNGGLRLVAVLEPYPVPARVTMTPGIALGLLSWVLDEPPGLTVRSCSTPGAVTGLPERATVDVPAGHGVVSRRPASPVRLYLVSALVAQALRGQGRDDVVTVGKGPNDLERKDGQVWGTYVLEQVPQ
jgi:hypothetical protein